MFAQRNTFGLDQVRMCSKLFAMAKEGGRAVDAPKKLLTLLEGRAPFELGAFVAATPALRMLGRGDSHPVLVLPGFTGNDRSTAPLRWWLKSQGYWSHGWGLGANIGPSERIVHGMRERLDQLASRHDRKVTLIGWSLGGVYARILAREAPDQVRQVITLGSPFRMREGDDSAASDLWEQFNTSTATSSASSPFQRTSARKYRFRRPPSTQKPTG